MKASELAGGSLATMLWRRTVEEQAGALTRVCCETIGVEVWSIGSKGRFTRSERRARAQSAAAPR